MESIHDKLITIYSKNDSSNNYNTQGLGALPDFTSAKVNGKLNGGEFFTGVYPTDGVNADKIVTDNILQMFIDEERPRQRMRIYNTNRKIIDGQILVEAEPIFSDIRRYVAKKFEKNTSTANEMFDAVKSVLTPAIPTKYRFVSTVDTIASVSIEQFNMLEFFGGKEGSILDRFKGEFRRDNNTLYHEKRIGQDHKVKLIYSKDLTGLELEVDASSIIIGIYPFISGDDETVDIELPEKVIFTEYANDYPNGLVQFVDFKDKATTVDELRTQAQTWLKLNADKTKPLINGKVEMVPLKHQQGYEKFITMNTVGLGDGVDVYHPELDDIITARIVEYTYDVLNDSYETLVIGNVKANFLENMDSTVNDLINDAIDQLKNGGEISDLINDIVDHQTDLITGNAGGYVLLDPKESPSRILVMDTPNKDTARNVLQINQNGIGFSKTGINGTYDTAWTLDGGFNASFITAGTITGITIKGSTLISTGADFDTTIQNGSILWHSKKLNRDVIDMYAQETTESDVGELFYQIKKGGGFRILDTTGNLIMSTYDNGTSAGSWLSFSSRELHWFGTRKSSDGSITYESMDHNSSYFRVKVNNKQLTFDSDGGITISDIATFNNVVGRINKNTIIAGDLSVQGSKNSTVETKSYGRRLLNAYETPEYYFADYGEGVTGEDGKLRVDIDPMFAETVNLDHYMTHVTPTKLVLCAVTKEAKDHFIIETSEPNVLVRWNIVAKRLGYEHVRLKEDKLSDKDVFPPKDPIN